MINLAVARPRSDTGTSPWLRSVEQAVHLAANRFQGSTSRELVTLASACRLKLVRWCSGLVDAKKT